MTFKKVTPGFNGGISLLGCVYSFIGAIIIGIIAKYYSPDIDYIQELIIVCYGYVGSIIDSIMGSLL